MLKKNVLNDIMPAVINFVDNPLWKPLCTALSGWEFEAKRCILLCFLKWIDIWFMFWLPKGSLPNLNLRSQTSLFMIVCISLSQPLHAAITSEWWITGIWDSQWCLFNGLPRSGLKLISISTCKQLWLLDPSDYSCCKMYYCRWCMVIRRDR